MLAARKRFLVAGGALIVLIAIAISVLRGGASSVLPAPPLPGIGVPPRAGDPFGYVASRQAAFVSRASAGRAQVLFTKSPGGALATAARVAAYRPLIDAATHGTAIDPDVVEAIVFLESAGRPDAIAGSDPVNASGLTQILAATGQSLLGMQIDLARSRRLTAQIASADNTGNTRLVARLLGTRAKVDGRFDPAHALAATVRYLEIAQQRFGRADLAVESYHMGIGNLQQVLSDYDGGRSVPYAQVYFDSAPDHNPATWRLLSSFGDDSSTYYWRVLGALQVMRLYRTDRAALRRLSRLETGYPSDAEVLQPPDRTASFADPAALAAAYTRHTVIPLPRNAAKLGLAYAATMGSRARQLGAPASLYRGLRAPALDLLIELAARVRAISGARAPLIVANTVADAKYESLLGFDDPPALTGYTFQIARRYASHAQAEAFQAMLDRLQSLNLIAWIRGTATIEITVAADADKVMTAGP
ncbi:MAG: transglycosylase SLT domain-containing protein [Actinomycetota bacterium]|nr:transglycosylase SLT domain-containing protein [Actinomycetota bacterium]